MKTNAKKIMTMAMALVIVASMAACGGNDNTTSSSVPSTSSSSVPPVTSSVPSEPTAPSTPDNMQYDATAQRYSKAITGARNEEHNSAFNIFTHDPDYNMSSYRNNYADMKKEDGTEYTEEEMRQSHDSAMEMQLSLLGLTEADVENYAISISPMNTRAYGVAIIKPAAGKEETVKKALENFITTQQKNFENYLPDQYEIAKSGYVKTEADGTMIMVLSEEQDTLYESIVKGLTDENGTGTASSTGSSVASSGSATSNG